MKCKWKDCSNDARAKSLYCGGTCKKRDSRASGTNVPVEVGQEQVGQPSGTKSDKPEQLPNGLPDNCKLSTASLEHYQANPDKYIKRLEPDKQESERITCEEYMSRPPVDVSKLSNAELQRELKYNPGANWSAPPEYAEVMRRKATA